MFKSEPINYTNYLKDKPQETDPIKIGTMKARLDQAIMDIGTSGKLGCTYYADGNVLVYINGEYYGVFNTNTGKFFGDCSDNRGEVVE